MIYHTLRALVEQLNDFLRSTFTLSTDIVQLVPVQGDADSATDNHVSVSIVGLERETAAGIRFEREAVGNSQLGTAPKWLVNANILFAVLFKEKQYGEAVRVLSAILLFLQRHTSFVVPESGARYAIEPVNLSYADQASLWGMLGVSYQPSVLVRIRLLTVESGEIVDISASVEGHDTATKAGGGGAGSI